MSSTGINENASVDRNENASVGGNKNASNDGEDNRSNQQGEYNVASQKPTLLNGNINKTTDSNKPTNKDGKINYLSTQSSESKDNKIAHIKTENTNTTLAKTEDISVKPIKTQSGNAEKEQKPCEVDVLLVRSGFDGARKLIEQAYKKYFTAVNFNPSLNEVVADLLATIGALSSVYGADYYYEKAFGISTSKIGGKYRAEGYVPICFKLSVWLDKNKGEAVTVNLLNEVLSSLFTLACGKVDVVKTSISKIIDFITESGVKIN